MMIFVLDVRSGEREDLEMEEPLYFETCLTAEEAEKAVWNSLYRARLRGRETVWEALHEQLGGMQSFLEDMNSFGLYILRSNPGGGLPTVGGYHAVYHGGATYTSPKA